MAPDDNLREIGTPDPRSSFFDGFHRSIVAFAEGGNNLIVEHVIEQQKWANDIRRITSHLDVFWVGLHAPIEVIELREIARRDRLLGEARYHLKTHSYCQYDLSIDISLSPEITAAHIVKAWKDRKTS